jgi:Caspase domain
MLATLLVTPGLALSLALAAGGIEPSAGARVAVVVGSNVAASGGNTLRYAHQDANALASVLVSNGGFEADDVAVLLDARPEAVLAELERARARLRSRGGRGILLFYYSGHADERALYPGGAPMSFEALRAQLGDEGVGVRIGIIDACRGGGWTQAKGLAPTAPFAVGLAGLSSEGTALLASSSGLEDSHETDQLRGSFFTHHLVAGLRGAADQSGDGQVSLTEAFAYASRFTVRDTATRTPVPQHPSFDLRLRGRQDVVLTSVGPATTQLLLAQTVGPLEVVQLSTGVTVVEGTPGEQVLRLALPPGAYLVRRVRGAEVLSREVQVVAGQATTLEESALTLVGTAALAPKGDAPEGRLAGRHQLQLSAAIDPLDRYFVRPGATLAYTYLFTSELGARAHLTWTALVPNGTQQTLTRDFGMASTSLQAVQGEADLAFVWQPTIVRGATSEVFATLGLGPAAAVGRFVGSRVAPGLAAGAELTWLHALGPGLSLGGVVSLHEGAFWVAGSVGDPYSLAAPPSPMHLTTLSLGAVLTFGPATARP